MSLDDALFLVQRSGTLHHSKGSDIGDRMVAGDIVLVQRGTGRFKATYDGNEWSTIRDSDLLLAWDGTNNRKVTGANFKTLFTPPPTVLAVYRKFSGTGNVTTSCGYWQSEGQGRQNMGSPDGDHWLFEIDSNGLNLKDLLLANKVNFPLYVSSSKHPTYRLDAFGGYASSECTVILDGSRASGWRPPWGGGIENGYIIKLHESLDVPFLEWDWRGNADINHCSESGQANTYQRSTNPTPYVYFGKDDLLEPDGTAKIPQVAKEVFDNIKSLNNDFWLRIDNGPAVKINSRGHSISTTDGCRMYINESNYVWDDDSLLKFFFINPPPGNKLKFYYHNPDQYKEEFKGVYIAGGSGSTGSGSIMRRLDRNGNPTSGSSYGLHIRDFYLNDRDANKGVSKYYPGATFVGLSNDAIGTWQNESARMLDYVQIEGHWGIRIVGNTVYDSNKHGAMIYGINLERP